MEALSYLEIDYHMDIYFSEQTTTFLKCCWEHNPLLIVAYVFQAI